MTTQRGLIMNIARQIQGYLEEKEEQLRETFKHPVSVTQEWNGYLIRMQGHSIRAARDSTAHRWRFILLDESHGGYFREAYAFYDISEKKGEAIIEFLKALAAVTKESSQDQRPMNEEIIGGAATDPSLLEEENFATAEEGDGMPGPGPASEPAGTLNQDDVLLPEGVRE